MDLYVCVQKNIMINDFIQKHVIIPEKVEYFGT